MSYPDLGCYAECLSCELCTDKIDLSFSWEDYDAVFGDDIDLTGWGPEEDDGNFFDDFDLPDIYPTVFPKDGGWIFGVGGRF